MTKDEAAAILNKRQGAHYPFIAIHCRHMGSATYYLSDEIQRAIQHEQPADTWATQRFEAASEPDMAKPYRLTDTVPEARLRMIRDALDRFPHSPVVQAAAILYADELVASAA